jgi:hypothetical protein
MILFSSKKKYYFKIKSNTGYIYGVESYNYALAWKKCPT